MEWILTSSIISGQLIKIPLGLGGITLLDLGVILILVLSIIKIKLKKPPLFVKAGFVFITICILSLIFTPLELTIQEIISSFFYTARWTLFLLLGWIVFSKQQFNPLRILEISGISIAGLGIFQWIFLPDLKFLGNQGWDPHFYRAASTFLDPNFLGAYLVLTLLILTNKRILFAFVYIALLLTFSRSSYLMFLVSFLTFSFLQKSKKLFFLTSALFLGLMLGFWIYTLLITAPHGVDRTASASYRLGTWQQGLTIFQKSPLLGVGFNSYRFAVRQYGLGDTQFLSARGSTSNDFSFLYILATTGILGLGAYLAFLISIFKTRSIIILAFLPGILIHSIFNNSLFYPFILIWIIILASDQKK